MTYIFGLGNPGEEYSKNRHNAGRMAVENFAKKNDLEFESDKKSKSLIAKNKKLVLVLPETFMNKSGQAISYFVKSKKAAGETIVVYDDIDLAFGTIKISFNKSSGGHNGLESVIKALKTRELIRIRIGVSPATAKGKIKKPSGEEAVLKFLLGNFKPTELETMKKVFKLVSEAIETILEDGKDKAMNQLN